MRSVSCVTLTLLLALLAVRPLVGQSERASDLDAKRKIWQSLPEEEKARLREKFRHYQALPEEEKAALKLRLGVLRELLEGEQQELPADDRPQYERLDRHGRHQFLLQRVRGALRQGPEILKKALGVPDDKLDSRSLLDRAAEANSRLFTRALDHLVQAGVLSRGERERVTRRFRKATAFERVRLIREYVIRNPSAFGFDESESTRLQRAGLPDFLNVLQRRLFHVLPIPDSFRLTDEQKRQVRALPPAERNVRERELVLSNVIRTLRAAGVAGPVLDRLREMPPGRMVLQAKRMLERARSNSPTRGPTPPGRRSPMPHPGRRRLPPAGDGAGRPPRGSGAG